MGPYGLSAGFPLYGYDAGGYALHGGFGVERGVVPLAANALAGAPVPAAAAPPSTASNASTGTAGTGTAGAGSTAGTQDFSTTNDQEAGVDEPDMVKTDGQLMVVLRQQPLGVQVVDVSGATPQLEGFLALPQLAEADGLFLIGQYAVVIGTLAPAPVPVPVPVYAGATGAPGASSAPVRDCCRASRQPRASFGPWPRPPCTPSCSGPSSQPSSRPTSWSSAWRARDSPAS